jgi:hypothetical protein
MPEQKDMSKFSWAVMGLFGVGVILSYLAPDLLLMLVTIIVVLAVIEYGPAVRLS